MYRKVIKVTFLKEFLLLIIIFNTIEFAKTESEEFEMVYLFLNTDPMSC